MRETSENETNMPNPEEKSWYSQLYDALGNSIERKAILDTLGKAFGWSDEEDLNNIIINNSSVE